MPFLQLVTADTELFSYLVRLTARSSSRPLVVIESNDYFAANIDT